jgi:hyaluronoglucosaminidase
LKQNNIDIKAGVIEGFFGQPWSWESRLSSADFLRDCGYQFYMAMSRASPRLKRE